jgi:hypothetical protein
MQPLLQLKLMLDLALLAKVDSILKDACLFSPCIFPHTCLLPLPAKSVPTHFNRVIHVVQKVLILVLYLSEKLFAIKYPCLPEGMPEAFPHIFERFVQDNKTI